MLFTVRLKQRTTYDTKVGKIASDFLQNPQKIQYVKKPFLSSFNFLRWFKKLGPLCSALIDKGPGPGEFCPEPQSLQCKRSFLGAFELFCFPYYPPPWISALIEKLRVAVIFSEPNTPICPKPFLGFFELFRWFKNRAQIIGVNWKKVPGSSEFYRSVTQYAQKSFWVPLNFWFGILPAPGRARLNLGKVRGWEVSFSKPQCNQYVKIIFWCFFARSVKKKRTQAWLKFGEKSWGKTPSGFFKTAPVQFAQKSCLVFFHFSVKNKPPRQLALIEKKLRRCKVSFGGAQYKLCKKWCDHGPRMKPFLTSWMEDIEKSSSLEWLPPHPDKSGSHRPRFGRSIDKSSEPSNGPRPQKFHLIEPLKQQGAAHL